MADNCPACLMPLWFDGVPFQDGVHCPDSPALNVAVRDEVACLRAGIIARDATIATLTERTKGVLRRVVAELGEALGDQPSVELQMRAELDPEGSEPGSEGFARDLPGEEVPFG